MMEMKCFVCISETNSLEQSKPAVTIMQVALCIEHLQQALQLGSALGDEPSGI